MAAMSSFHGRCTVCGQALSEKQEYGGRTYCPVHLTTFYQDVRPVWRASIFAFGLTLLIIAGTVAADELIAAALPDSSRLLIGIGIALLPGLMWLLVIYRAGARGRMDVSALLLTLYILGLLIAAAATRPLLSDLLGLDIWLTQVNPTNRFLGYVLIIGPINAFLLSSIVRYSVWRTPIFTHRVDGVLYALAVAWGYAAALGLLFVLEQGGLSLLNGNLRLLTHTYAYLTTGLVTGYFLGRNRFEDMPFFYLPAGVALSAVLNGVLLYGGNELNNIRLDLTTSGFSPWPGLAFNLAVLIMSYSAIYGLIRRHNALSRGRVEHGK